MARPSWRRVFAAGWATAVAGILIGLRVEPGQFLAGLSFWLTVGGLLVCAGGLLLAVGVRRRRVRD